MLLDHTLGEHEVPFWGESKKSNRKWQQSDINI